MKTNGYSFFRKLFNNLSKNNLFSKAELQQNSMAVEKFNYQLLGKG